MRNSILNRKGKINMIKPQGALVMLILFLMLSVEGWSAPTVTISGSASVCIGATYPVVTFTPSGGVAPYTITYTLNGGSDLTIESSDGSAVTIAVPTETADTYMYTLVSVKDANEAVSVFGIATVTVYPNMSIASVTGESPLCIDGTAAYTANSVVLGGAGIGAWSSSNTTIATVSSEGLVTGASAGTCEIIYTVTGECGPSVSAKQEVTINPNMSIASVTGTSPLCIDGTATYTANSVVLGGAGIGAWSSSNTSIATVSSEGLVTGASAGSCDIIYTITGGCGTSVSAMQPVTINPNASIGSVTGTTSLCVGGIETFTANSVVLGGSGTGAWSSSNTAIATVNSSGLVTGVSAGNCNILYTITGGCACPVSNSTEISIAADPAITLHPISPDAVCLGGTLLPLTVTATGGTPNLLYQWYSNTNNTNTGGASITDATTNSYTPPTGIAGTVYYYCVVSANGSGCGAVSSSTAEVIVAADPAISVQPVKPSEVCIGGTFPAMTLTATGGTPSLKYQWYSNIVNSTVGGVAISGATTNSYTPEATTAGTKYCYCVVSADGSDCGTAISNVVEVTVNPIPTATISGTIEVCTGDPSPEIRFTGASGTSPYTFTYTLNGGSNRTVSTASGSDITTIIVPTSTATTYTYTLVSVRDASSSACMQAQSGNAIVTVNPLPTGTISGTTTVCENSTSPLVTFTGGSGTAPYTFVYTINSGEYQTAITQSGDNAVTVSVPTDVPGTYTYSLVSVTDASATMCTKSLSGSATVKINSLPAAPVIGTITVPTCSIATGSVKLTGLPSVGTWTLTRSPGSVATTGTGTTSTIAGLAEGTYTFMVTNSLSCTSLVSDEVVIPAQPPMPTVSITNPASVCSPATVNLTATAVTSGSSPDLIFTYWTNSSATIAFATPAAATAGTYYIKGTNSYGCYEIKPVVVTVNQTPAANAGTGGNECDLNFTFNATASVGIGTWSLSSGPGTVLFSPNANSPTATANVSTYGTYVFTWTEVNGDCSSSNSVSVNFYEQPVVTTEPGGNNCGLEFYLSATKNVGVGTWTMVSGSGTATFRPDANSPSTMVTVNSYGTYSFKWTAVNGTCSASSTVTVKFIEQPSADAGSGGDECDQSFILNAVPGTGTTGLWKLLNGPGTATFSPSSASPTGTVSVSAYGNYSFAWTEANSICKSTDIINVVFHPRPTVSAGPDMNICEGSAAQLAGTGIGTFSWQPDSLLDFPDRSNPLALPLENTTFILTLTDQYNCVNTDEIIVSLWEQPVANAGTDQVLEYLFLTNLGAEPASTGTGKWSVASGAGVFEDSTDPLTSVTGLSLHKNELKWTVTNGVCPESSDIVLITVDDLKVPTLITPNGDPYNEFLVFKGLESLGKTELVVLNRRGVVVFESKNYNNDWNGIDNNGNELPDDTYFIILKAENGKSLSNYIVIRR